MSPDVGLSLPGCPGRGAGKFVLTTRAGGGSEKADEHGGELEGALSPGFSLSGAQGSFQRGRVTRTVAVCATI